MEGSTTTATEGHVVGIPVSTRAYGIEEPDFPAEETQTPDRGEFPSSFQYSSHSHGESLNLPLFLMICLLELSSLLQEACGRNQENRSVLLIKLFFTFSFRCYQLNDTDDHRSADEQSTTSQQEGRQDRSGHQRAR